MTLSKSKKLRVGIVGASTLKGREDVEKLLETESLTVIQTADEPPSPVQVSGSDSIQIGGLKRDFLNPKGMWFWAASDNLRVASINAVVAAERILLQ